MKEMFDEIREVLMDKWDPIGVKGIPEAEDEYDAYIPMVFKMLWAKVSKQKIVEYLWCVETECMGLEGKRSRLEEVAEKLQKLFEKKEVQI